MSERFYFGRGSGACVCVEMWMGPYCRIFMGNEKTQERGEYMLLDRDQLYKLSEFFRALWQDRGQDFQIRKICDDPHDEVLFHDMDFSVSESGEMAPRSRDSEA